MRKFSFYFFICLFFCACFAPSTIVWQDQPNNRNIQRTRSLPSNMPSKPGACFAKATMPDITSVNHITDVPMYTGLENDPQIDTKEITLESTPATTKWVKKKADKKCLSNNPDDCLVWCLIEVPAVTKNYTIVVDTSLTDQWELVQHEHLTPIQSGGHHEWVEVICDNKLTESVKKHLQRYLSNHNYYSGPIDGILDRPLYDALTQFQKDNMIASGALSLETLVLMDIDY